MRTPMLKPGLPRKLSNSASEPRSQMFFDSEVKSFGKDGYFVVNEMRAKFKKPAVLGGLL